MILVGFGSNISFSGLPPAVIVAKAVSALARTMNMVAVSRLYSSPAWPDPNDPPFVNAAACVETNLLPHALLNCLHGVEAGFGRRRSAKNAPRTLDLDLLAYNREIIETPGGLRLPHPALASRDFVLAPLCDIAPGWTHPVSGRSAAQMMAALDHRAAQPLDEK